MPVVRTSNVIPRVQYRVDRQRRVLDCHLRLVDVVANHLVVELVGAPFDDGVEHPRPSDDDDKLEQVGVGRKRLEEVVAVASDSTQRHLAGVREECTARYLSRLRWRKLRQVLLELRAAEVEQRRGGLFY